VEIFPGETHEVRCEVESLPGFSAHADRAGLLAWLQEAAQQAQAVFVVHGEQQAAFAFRDAATERLALPIYIPEVFDCYDLLDVAATPNLVTLS